MVELNSLKGSRERKKFPVSYFNLKYKTMKINVQFEKMPTNQSVENLAIKKLQKLNKKFDWIIAAKTFYKLEKDPKGKGKICRIELSLPGPKIVAFSNEETFEEATDETIRDLKIQLKKRKGEMKPFA
ncbi:MULTISPECIES: HPF/RaiA family ribosome-associated protein [Flavobacteriaceae]|nr:MULTISPECIES: HPF/RaiA family ribosome-associated protein [Flavobacteriaceae]GGK52126.1 hypothetical protein GCM10007963_20560 [Lutibacter litoralis]